MTNNQHPITPPPELVQKLWDKLRKAPDASVDAANAWTQAITEAAQWGADMELEACCEFLDDNELCDPNFHKDLRNVRRPKPLSLKEQALCHLESFAGSIETLGMDSDLIRRALEALPDG